MNFLDNLVLPQSAEHLQLLNYLLALSLLVLIPYLAVLLGFTFISAIFYRKGISSSNEEYLKISKLLIDSVTFNKVMVLGFGFIPLITTGLILVQVLYLSGVHVENYFYISIISFIVSFLFIYSFKHSLGIYLVTKTVSNNQSDEIVKDYAEKTKHINKKYPAWGLFFLLISVYFLTSGIQLSTNNILWGTDYNFFSSLLSFSTIFYFLAFLSLSVLLSYSVFIFLLKKNENDFTENYLQEFSKTGLSGVLISVITYTLFITLRLVFTPYSGLSFDYFLLMIFTFVFLLIIANQSYNMLKELKLKSVNSVLFVTVIVILLSVVQNTSAFSISSNREITKIADKYLIYQDEFKQSLGITTVVISGEEIYKGKCIACHAFDKKVVGPPYNQVLVKYEGKIDDLVKFILNPVKINPDYPAMPNQGVKPAEAKAVAEYILSTYKK